LKLRVNSWSFGNPASLKEKKEWKGRRETNFGSRILQLSNHPFSGN